MRRNIIFTVLLGVAIATLTLFGETADARVHAIVRECRELLAAEKLDEATARVKDAIAISDAGLRAKGTIYNVYADIARKRGETSTADKSLLKAYDFLLKARDAATSDGERTSMIAAAKGVAKRLNETEGGRTLLEGYTKKKAEKRAEERAAEVAKRQAERAAMKTAAKTKKGGASSSAGVVNTWNPWKKPISAHVFDPKTPKDSELPWSPLEVEKMFGIKPGTGIAYLRGVHAAIEKKFNSRRRALHWLEYVLEKPTKFELPREHRQSAWNYYGLHAFYSVEQDRIRQAMVGLKKCGGQATEHFRWRAVPTIRMYDEMVKFPIDTDTIVFPKENIWVRSKRTVHADRYGWNPLDATAAIQKALDDPKGDIVVIDKKESPWLITSVKVPSNKTIIFEKGVRVFATEKDQIANSRNTMFAITHEVENVALIGKGDVVIGKYPDGETRNKYLNGEGGTGIYIEAAKNVVVRDLDVKECGCDGITLGGCHNMNRFIYLENIVLEHNARQALSMCNGCDVFMKNISFLNTRGAQPMCGIDFEPSIQEVEGTINIYIIDCKFENNHGGNVVFSESSTYPVTVLFKNCDIGSHDYGTVSINALCGLYQGNNTDAPSDIIFDSCRIKGVSWCPPVTIENANLFHVTFRNCDIEQVKGQPCGIAPFNFNLNREYYSPKSGNRAWYEKEGSLAFVDTRIKGWNNAEALSFTDKTGHYSVKNIFGKVNMNGRTVDMTKYRYDAPDFIYGDVPWKIDAEDLVPPTGKQGKDGTVAFSWRGPWWVGEMSYELFTRNGNAYTAQSFDGKNGDVIARAGKAGTAFRCLTGDGLFRLEAPSTVYFIVPEGDGDAVLKFVGIGKTELLKGREKVVETYTGKNFKDGHCYVKIKRQKKPAVYGLRVVSGGLTFKFLAPFSGLVSGDADSVPTLNSDEIKAKESKAAGK